MRKHFGTIVRSYCFSLVLLPWLAFAQPQSLSLPASSTNLSGTSGGEILWDEFGIPHIYAPDLLSVVRGFGFAQMVFADRVLPDLIGAANASGDSSAIAAAQQLQTQFGGLEVRFGQVNRIVLVGHDSTFQQVQPLTNLPASGSPDPFGGIRVLQYFPAPAPFNNQNWAFNGDTYVQLVEFTPDGAKAQALLSYGNASRPGSSHITDQLPFFQAKQLRPVYRTRDEVQAHVAKRETF